MSNYRRLHVGPRERFGRWTVVNEHGRDQNGRRTFLCICDCGVEGVVAGTYLTCGRSQSCGCLQRERAPGAKPTHGRSRTPEYRAWQQMKFRCTNPNAESWVNYGGRGIRVCQKWIDSFEAFLDHIGPRPSSRHSLDRIDNDGDYEPGNVRWALKRTQARNRRRPRVATASGQWTWRGKLRPA